ncbi:LlaJI family restriction endonuclease [Acinetobacter nosocomialis]|uniref:LlaJI family restriction endonuclease n=1 Tax=Acinetobacter nosocomialis TaxID=106654 RepID=UPI00244A96DF|nr:LlaJI family restriction endonuclease [Acinetobacter nosocomialis]MDH2591537.1 LlaJI family restriction endonuclease [Acinetobacter nosocomialis]
MKNNHYLLDRNPVNELPNPVADFIQGQGLLSSINGLRVSFCGLVSYQGENYFFFPRQSDIEKIKRDPEQYTALLMQALFKFAQDSKTQVTSPEDGADETGFEKLEMFKYLINDFQQHGIFKNEEVLLRKNSGKTDWKKTINRSVSFPNSSGRPVYLDVYGKQRTSTNSEITRIHAGILKQVYKNYGFIFTGKNKVPYSLKQYGETSLSTDAQISVLKNEIRNHFADRQTLLLKILIEYLEAYKGNEQKNQIIGVTRFHVAWEHMLSKSLDYVIDINSKLPKPVFIKPDGTAIPAKKSGMRTDIVIEDKAAKKLTILDAKYYEATSIENAPGWADLVKQFFYEKAISIMPEFSGYQFENALIFPGQKNAFDKIHMQDQKSGHYLDTVFPIIKCIYLDPMMILESYHQKRKIKSLVL